VWSSERRKDASDIAKETVKKLKKNEEKIEQNLTIQNIIKLDPDTISHWLIESVAMVRDLL